MEGIQAKLACDGYSGAGSKYKTLYINCKACHKASEKLLDPTLSKQKYFKSKYYVFYDNPTYYT